MEAWKKALVAGSAGTSAILFLKKKWPAGVLTAGVALAVLASEYPEKFEDIRSSLPEYFDRGMRLLEMTSRVGQKITQFAQQGGRGIWDELSS
jgi:hypothetical protein